LIFDPSFRIAPFSTIAHCLSQAAATCFDWLQKRFPFFFIFHFSFNRLFLIGGVPRYRSYRKIFRIASIAILRMFLE
jgi:hypothetical protein